MTKKIVLTDVPTENIIDGLLVIFDAESSTMERFAFADIEKGKTEYYLPDDNFMEGRKIEGIYQRIQ